MNKKFFVYNVLMVLLLDCRPSFSMYNTIFKIARAIGIMTLPTSGLYIMNEKNKFIEENLTPISETAIEEWGREIMQQLHVPNAESISFVNGNEWATGRGKIIYVPIDGKVKLNKALEQKKSPIKTSFYNPFSTYKNHNKTILLQHNKIIDENSMILKHEIGHIIYNDNQTRIYASAAIPVGIETISFGATSALKKLCGVKPPKTLIGTIVRSSITAGAIMPKAFIGGVLYCGLNRYQEECADQFACENAETIAELEAFKNYMQTAAQLFEETLKTNPKKINKNYEKKIKKISCQLQNPQLSEKDKKGLINRAHAMFDPGHPYPTDRAAMVQTYLDKWDQKL